MLPAPRRGLKLSIDNHFYGALQANRDRLHSLHSCIREGWEQAFTFSA